MKIVEQESLKQLCTTPLNSQGQTWQGPTTAEKNCNCQHFKSPVKTYLFSLSGQLGPERFNGHVLTLQVPSENVSLASLINSAPSDSMLVCACVRACVSPHTPIVWSTDIHPLWHKLTHKDSRQTSKARMQEWQTLTQTTHTLSKCKFDRHSHRQTCTLSKFSHKDTSWYGITFILHIILVKLPQLSLMT